MGKIRGTHSSPGIYTQITDLSYAAKTLGITTLGLVGETVKGPAFEPIMISNYASFQDYFGGTSAEKFKDTQYPKYELPYIAKSYLQASEQLYVCRVLGLSGYNAGPAFVITAEDLSGTTKHVVAILRSRGSYVKYANVGTDCDPISKYDTLNFDCDTIELKKYTNLSVLVKCDEIASTASTETEIAVSALNYGQFTIVAKKDGEEVGRYPVSLNPGAKDYIYNVLGSKASEGSAAVFVEELYDLHLINLIEGDEVVRISSAVTKINELSINAVTDPVRDFLTIAQDNLKKSNIGQTFLGQVAGNRSNGYMYISTGKNVETATDTVISSGETPAITYYLNAVKKCNGKYKIHCEATSTDMTLGTLSGFTKLDDLYVYDSDTEYNEGDTFKMKLEFIDAKTSEVTELRELGYQINPTDVDVELPVEVGQVYIVKTLKDANTGKKYYKYYAVEGGMVGQVEHGTKIDTVDAVNVLSYDAFFCLDEDGAITAMTDKSDYHEQFRCASTPWIVSEIKGSDVNDLHVKKLFRFHTISDGVYANEQVKISIANINPDEGTFDVYVRDFGDSDGNQTILESYRGLTMVPGDSKYIGLQIGTLNGDYESKSKYVMVEIIENDMTETCVPAGFLGYPVRDYSEEKLEAPSFVYNTIYDEDIREKKQYFGLSDLTGVDVDMLYYKGKNAYTDNYTVGYTKGFHLDSTLSPEILSAITGTVTVRVEGEDKNDVFNVEFETVSPNNVGVEGLPPVLGSDSDMEGTIYEDIKLRKFTVYPYGGFDGWDIYRGSRTTGNDFKANKYKGTITNGHGATFSKISDGTALCLTGNCITSDYYAFLAGANQFENPEKFSINLFATPGIDYVNQTYLTQEILEMVEEKRFDSLYVVTTPDKPQGASDAVSDMYSSSDAASNLEDTSIDTYYAATYYPWIKFFDTENNKFINLPATKDVLRNMADVDNKKYPWYAPAGIERGNVDCTKMHFFAKIEDEDNVYDGRINPLKTFSKDGVKVWGNKTLYTGDTPMNRINVVRLMLYMRKLIIESTRGLIFEPNDTTLKDEFESIVKPILTQIKKDRGITDFQLNVSQTTEEMDAHELSCKLFVKPTPTLEYIEINFVVTPQGVNFEDL